MGRELKHATGSQFVQWYGPVLDALRALGGSGTPDEVADHIAGALKISDAKLNETLPSGQLRFKNQVRWARYYLMRAGFIDSSRRGIWSLTEKGLSTSLTPEQAQEVFQKVLKSYQEDRRKRKVGPAPAEEPSVDEQEPSPDDYRERLLTILRSLPPPAFERLSQRLLREAGFVQVTVTGSSGDGGIDGHGTLQINPLVSFRVLFQCKRYAKAVSPSYVRDFRGAMTGRADKGIMITTSTFTAEAKREASRDGAPPIELIDGEKLVEMFENLELGLKPIKAFEIDDHFFDEFRS